MRRQNPYANISLAAPDEALQPQIPAPQAPRQMNWMQFDTPQMEAPDTAGQVEGLGKSMLGLKRKYFGGQEKAIGDALKGAKGMMS